MDGVSIGVLTFDFYDCTDAAGNHYAIVNAGGLLWMTEDLKMQPQTLVPNFSSQQEWADYPSTLPKAAYYQFNVSNASQGAYYNFAGAKAALPQGWTLPTAGEIDYMMKSLGMTTNADTTGYNNERANLLKARGAAWSVQQTAPDTLSRGIEASGLLSPEGAFTGRGWKVNYWTRSTKNSLPIWWGIENTSIKLNKTETADVSNGFRVCGVRPAPSAYRDVLDLFQSSASSTSMRTSAAEGLFAEGPLGGMYTVVMEKHKLFTDLTRTSRNQKGNNILGFSMFLIV
jgi:uncharacterized protein (TIGR02145 family)